MLKSLIVAAALALAAAPAVAGGHTWKVGNDTFNVHLTDLDLQTVAGRAEALVRIERAADRLCRSQKLQVDRDACRAGAVAQASQGAAGPMLRQALTERTKGNWDVARAK